MISIKTFLFVYLLGGVTFIPITVAIIFYLITSPKKDVEDDEAETLAVGVDPEFKVGEVNELKGVATKKQGYLHVTRQFYPHQTDFDHLNEGADETESNTNNTSTDQQRTRDKLKKKDKFYAVLKHGNLFLYKDSSPGAGPQQVIVLKDAFISIWPRTVSPQDDTPLPDGSLFTKKTCISIWKKRTAYLDELNQIQFRRGGPSDQFFIYLDLNSDKEDWYFALIQATKLSECSGKSSNLNVEKALSAEYAAQTAHFSTKDVLHLIQTLNSTEEQHSSQWFNALLGRLFLSLQQTETLSDALRDRINKKLQKINKPGLLDDFSIEKVTVGNSAPVITNPKLLDLNPEGLTKVSFDFSYTGHLHLIIATKVNLNLGSRFKKREVDIRLSLTVKKVEGPIVVLIKPPPTNRLWYAFQTEPLLDLDCEPVVSTRQLSNNMVTNMIKSKLKEAIKESIVLPYMDDMVFYKTTSDVYRGGIWNSNKPEADVNTEEFDSIKSEGQSNTGFKIRESEDIPNVDYVDGKSFNSSVHTTSFSDTLSPASELEDIDPPEKSLDSSRSFLKSKNTDDSDLSIRSKSSVDSMNSNTTKRYLQTGIKKFGRWYKDQVATVKEPFNDDEGEPDLSKSKQAEGDLAEVTASKFTEETKVLEDCTSTSQTAASLRVETSFKSVEKPKTTESSKTVEKPEAVEKPTTPEMITNRRTSRNRNSSFDNSKLVTHNHHVESHRAEMFVNRSRAGSGSGPLSPSSPSSEVFRRQEINYSFSNNESMIPHPISSSDFPQDAEPNIATVNIQKKAKRPPPPLPPR